MTANATKSDSQPSLTVLREREGGRATNGEIADEVIRRFVPNDEDLLIHTGLTVLPGREGNDAVDEISLSHVRARDERLYPRGK